ncbi:MAG: Glu/Leu/Phe/Val dehydrogenase [Armatimonadetes bacterium]|nr:Glu/Leu/Phe/Val dehydrogenase [Armatimonadota bacterium]
MALFDWLRARGMTRLTVLQDWRQNAFEVYAVREWDESARWSEYPEKDPALPKARVRSLDASRLLGDAALQNGLADVLDLMRLGRHERLDLAYEPARDIRFIAAVHSTGLGPGAGGLRRHERREPLVRVIADILNLARGMSFKCAAAGIAHGGSKLGVHGPLPAVGQEEDYYAFLGYCIDRSGTFTGPDMGFSLEDADRIRRYTRNIVGGTAESGSSGATGRTAAYGVALSVEEALKFQDGIGSVEERHIAVQGLGLLGQPLADYLVRWGARLTVSDILPEAVARFRESLPGRLLPCVQAVPPEEILSVSCDILAPCALGGVIARASLPGLRCGMILGGANNQLRAGNEAEEIALARELASRDIVFMPDWIVNAGGVIHGKLEHTLGPEFDPEEALEMAARTCVANTRLVLERSLIEQSPPLEVAYRLFGEAIYGEAGE